MKYLTRQEEMVLLTVYRLKDDPYLVNIMDYLNESADKKWSISSVYVPLDRLSSMGYLVTDTGAPTAKRGGKAIKHYRLTEKGANALTEVKRIHETMWDGIETIITD